MAYFFFMLLLSKSYGSPDTRYLLKSHCIFTIYTPICNKIRVFCFPALPTSCYCVLNVVFKTQKYVLFAHNCFPLCKHPPEMLFCFVLHDSVAEKLLLCIECNQSKYLFQSQNILSYLHYHKKGKYRFYFFPLLQLPNKY